MQHTHQGRRHSSRRFTLVELMVTMFILSLMMLLVLQLIIYSQRLWHTAGSSTLVYENARVALDVIERDLRSSIATNLPGHQIGFYIGAPVATDPAKCLVTTFVATADPPSPSHCELCEVCYRYYSTSSTATNFEPFTLYRQVTSDVDTVNWDFTGQPNDWYLNNTVNPHLADYEKLIGGVADFSFVCYDSNDQIIPPNTDVNQLPSRIQVSLTVFDERLTNAPDVERFRTERTFTKIFRLGDLQNQ